MKNMTDRTTDRPTDLKLENCTYLNSECMQCALDDRRSLKIYYIGNDLTNPLLLHYCSLSLYPAASTTLCHLALTLPTTHSLACTYRRAYNIIGWMLLLVRSTRYIENASITHSPYDQGQSYWLIRNHHTRQLRRGIK